MDGLSIGFFLVSSLIFLPVISNTPYTHHTHTHTLEEKTKLYLIPMFKFSN